MQPTFALKSYKGKCKFQFKRNYFSSQDNVRKGLRKTNSKKLEANEIDREHYNKMLPEITFSENITLHIGEQTVLAFHIHNADTDSDTIFHEKQCTTHRRYVFCDALPLH